VSTNDHVLIAPDVLPEETPHAPTLTVSPASHRRDWPSGFLLAAVVVFCAAGVVALFVVAPLALPLAGVAWLCWGVREARAALRGCPGWRSWLRAGCRFAGVAATGLLLIVGIVEPACWVLGVSFLAMHALLATDGAPRLLPCATPARKEANAPAPDPLREQGPASSRRP
jgi:hypothetical protein